eukprot:gnl/TRDRNA2_/TRDRNA2_125805_c0_seq1.p1 gnl/TRDRNA2_/TRDRNA2_125805_c0~~gnl/TRDRNA2_/TRDRNA2_125805_c0_seq1.p1  ORF type:complete len:482 (-),score=50.81 gnl/TRDRNA2_/TRDRNA2_125805_c0_seq1:457-1740(-)
MGNIRQPMIDKWIERSVKGSWQHREDLDSTALGKTGHLATPASRSAARSIHSSLSVPTAHRSLPSLLGRQSHPTANRASNVAHRTAEADAVASLSRRSAVAALASAGDAASFPDDYGDVTFQCQNAVKAALKDGRKLMEVEFPSFSLESKPGEDYAGLEFDQSALLMTKILRGFADNKTRVLFPDRREEKRMTRKNDTTGLLSAATNPAASFLVPATVFGAGYASQAASGGDFYQSVAFASTVAAVAGAATSSAAANAAEAKAVARFAAGKYRTGYLVNTLAAVTDFGLQVEKSIGARCEPDDSLYAVAYPSTSVDEMLAVKELYDDLTKSSGVPIITFNGEIDRIRSGYYGPAFLNPKLDRFNKELLPDLETVYYIRNFKGRNPGVLYRCYPGPWLVLRREPFLQVVQEFDTMPTLPEVSEILKRS